MKSLFYVGREMANSNLVDLKMRCDRCHGPVRLALDGVCEQLRVLRCERCGAVIILDPDFVPAPTVPVQPAVRQNPPQWRDRRLAA
jgi:hypothetical protein